MSLLNGTEILEFSSPKKWVWLSRYTSFHVIFQLLPAHGVVEIGHKYARTLRFLFIPISISPAGTTALTVTTVTVSIITSRRVRLVTFRVTFSMGYSLKFPPFVTTTEHLLLLRVHFCGNLIQASVHPASTGPTVFSSHLPSNNLFHARVRNVLWSMQAK